MLEGDIYGNVDHTACCFVILCMSETFALPPPGGHEVVSLSHGRTTYVFPLMVSLQGFRM